MNKVDPAMARGAIKKHKFFRRLRWKVQLLFLIALNPLWLPAWRTYRQSGVCLPILNCHGCVLAASYCPIGVMGDMLSLRMIPWLAIGTFGAVGALFGRLSCGWACPFGFLQDLLAKLPTRKFALPRWTRAVKYVVLGVSVIAVSWFIGVGSWLFFCRTCPMATLSARIPAWLSGKALFTEIDMRVVILVLTLTLVIFVTRGFCRLFCPIGAGLALLNRVSLLSIKWKEPQCTECMWCVKNCPTGCRPLEKARDSECVHCLECFRCTALKLNYAQEEGPASHDSVAGP